MKTRIIGLCWDNERELFETNASDKQILKIISRLQKEVEDYNTDDFTEDIKSLGLTINYIDIEKEFNF